MILTSFHQVCDDRKFSKRAYFFGFPGFSNPFISINAVLFLSFKVFGAFFRSVGKSEIGQAIFNPLRNLLIVQIIHIVLFVCYITTVQIISFVLSGLFSSINIQSTGNSSTVWIFVLIPHQISVTLESPKRASYEYFPRSSML